MLSEESFKERTMQSQTAWTGHKRVLEPVSRRLTRTIFMFEGGVEPEVESTCEVGRLRPPRVSTEVDPAKYHRVGKFGISNLHNLLESRDACDCREISLITL